MRTEPEFLAEVFSAAVAAGATTLNAPDTVGYTTPGEIVALFRYLRQHVLGAERVVFSSHCHDDLGMAVANSLAAVSAGARQVECTINGIGERAGNAALEEMVMALKVRAPHFGVDTRIDTRQLYPTSRLLTELTGTDGTAQQGDRGRQRVRARVGHPPARHAQASRHLRNHAAAGRRHRRNSPGDGQALRPRCAAPAPAGAGPHARRRGAGRHLHPLQDAGRPRPRTARRRPGSAGAGPRPAGRRPVAPGAAAHQLASGRQRVGLGEAGSRRRPRDRRGGDRRWPGRRGAARDRARHRHAAGTHPLPDRRDRRRRRRAGPRAAERTSRRARLARPRRQHRHRRSHRAGRAGRRQPDRPQAAPNTQINKRPSMAAALAHGRAHKETIA